MKHVALLSLPFFAALAAPAAADEWYVGANVGFSAETSVEGVSLTDEPTYGAALGYDFGTLRLQGGVQRLSGDFGAGLVDGDATDWNAGVYIDVPVGNGGVYGGAGVDYMTASANIFGTSIDGEGTGWHLGAGAYYPISSNVTLEAGVRRIEAELDFSGTDVSLETWTSTLGFRLAL